MPRALWVALLASATAIATASDATPAKRHAHAVVRPGGIGVAIDQARLVTFARPAKTIFVANPVIAEINVVDARHAFVLGKTFGLTNLIALDSDGRQIESRVVAVTNHGAAVTLNRGAEQYNISCATSHCEITPRPGDPLTFVDNTEKAIAEHQEPAVKAALPPAGQAQTPVD